MSLQRYRRRRGSLLALSIMLVACTAATQPQPAPEGAPADFPIDTYRNAAADAYLYEVDAMNSLVQVFVYRGGALARLGHDHVVASRDLTGYVMVDAGRRPQLQADLYLALAAMTVDEDDLREAAGFTTTPSDDDRAGTRTNMLKSLEAAEFPFVGVSVERTESDAPRLHDGTLDVDVAVSLHGQSVVMQIPVDIRVDDGTLRVSGEFEILQTDFGVEPFSVLGGALTVQDKLDIRFDIVADRISPPFDTVVIQD